jgi:hypothetical protein
MDKNLRFEEIKIDTKYVVDLYSALIYLVSIDSRYDIYIYISTIYR